MLQNFSKSKKLSKRLIYKIRHRKGHGIHSPFVFNLVNNVIEEKRHYYCYSDIKAHLKRIDEPRLKIDKVSLLCFRIANYMKPASILELGSGNGITTLFLSSYDSNCQCYCYESDINKIQIAKKLKKDFRRNITFLSKFEEISEIPSPDCIFINLRNLNNEDQNKISNYVLNDSTANSIMIIGIRDNRQTLIFWEKIAQHADRTAKLDLFHNGIIFFNSQLSRYSYQISF